MSMILFNDPRVVHFVAQSVGSTDCSATASIGVEEGGKVVAGVVYDNFNGANIFIHFTVAQGYQICRGFLRLVFGYAFDCLKAKRITGAFSSANEKVRRFGERLGFQFETLLKDAAPDGDLMFYTLRREQCRFVGKKVEV